MGMLEWAKREVEIACKRERMAESEDEFDYACACYESALKAYNSLMEDAHSGCSLSATRQILMRLIDRKPLTPIEDTDDVWNAVTYKRADYKHYQCKRMSSLFKNVYKAGTTKYSDINRIVSYDLESINPAIGFFSGLVTSIIDDMFPIEMPYIPDNHIKVYIREFLTDRKNGDFDTVSILYAIFPDGERKEINRYFKESKNGWEEISENEMEERQTMHNYRILKEKDDCNA